MTPTARHDAQAVLNNDAARATAINTALADLADVAMQELRRGLDSPEIRAAVRNVREARA